MGFKTYSRGSINVRHLLTLSLAQLDQEQVPASTGKRVNVAGSAGTRVNIAGSTGTRVNIAGSAGTRVKSWYCWNMDVAIRTVIWLNVVDSIGTWLNKIDSS